MEQYIDLHIHTTASDGSKTPEEIVDMAISAGLSAIAITDHDTVSGVKRAMEYAKNKPIRVIPGIELSANYIPDGPVSVDFSHVDDYFDFSQKEVHILGYNVDYQNNDFLSLLSKMSSLRFERNRLMVDKLNKECKINISMEELSDLFPGAAITRANIAVYLVKNGYVENETEAFNRYLGNSTPYYIHKLRPSDAFAAALIKSAGGIPVLAHPVLYKNSDFKNRKLFDRAGKIGIRGVEARYSVHGEKDLDYFSKLADLYGLFTTGGSDYHGDAKPNIQLGCDTKGDLLKVPESVLEHMHIGG